MRTVFLGSPPFATPILERLIGSHHRPELVVTPPARPRGRGRRVVPSPVAELARAAELPLLEPETVKDEAFLEALRAVDADVFLVVSYGELLRQSFLDLPREVCLNVHPSLLPRHRGATPVQAALLAGDEVTGVSIQKVVLELDAGDVLCARETRVLPGETAGELFERLAALSGDLAVEALDAVAGGDAVYTPQDPARVTHCRKLSKEDGRVDWARPAVELERHVRAMNPWPLAFTYLPGGAAGGPGDKLALHRAQVLPRAGAAAPGALLVARERLVVACGEGALELTEVQAAGKRAMPAGDFLRGARLEAGQVLGAEVST